MKKRKLFWAVVVLLLLATAWRLSWPRFLPVMRLHGDAPPREFFEEMVNQADLIVLADVKSVKQGPDFVSSTGDQEPAHVGRVPTQRVTLNVVKVYQGDAAPGQTLTLYQGYVGVTWSGKLPLPFFMIDENDPVYKRGERYVLMLIPAFIPEELKPFQPEAWQEGMVVIVYPEGRMHLNADGTVTSALDTFGTNGKTLEEIEEKIATTAASLPSRLAQARGALLTYFSVLHSQDYNEVIYFYGGSYGLLRAWNPSVDPNDFAALFENGCTINGLMCLEARTVVQEEEISPREFKFVVEFMNEAGSLFVSGPETSPQSQFVFTVSKDENGKFLVQDLPVYAP